MATSNTSKPMGILAFLGLAVVVIAGYFIKTYFNPSNDTSPTHVAQASQPSAPVKSNPSAAKAEPTKSDASTIRFGLTKAPAKTPGTVRITTFNIENLFDDKDDPKVADDQNMTKPAAHMQAAADAIRALDCDILCLQEVESADAVKWFRDKYLSGMGYEHIASIDAGDGRGIEQAVLSRFPLKNPKVYLRMKLGGRQPDSWGNTPNNDAGKPFVFKRSPLQVTVEIPNTSVADLLKKAGKPDARAETYELTLFVCHLKSGGRDYEPQRTAEAGGVVSLVAAMEKDNPKANIIVLGDMNSLIIHEPMKKFIDAKLHGIWEDRAAKDTATMTHTTARCIDHLFYNTNVAKELVLSSKFVLGMPARPDRSNPNETPAPAGYASDHYPVSIDLRPIDTN